MHGVVGFAVPWCQPCPGADLRRSGEASDVGGLLGSSPLCLPAVVDIDDEAVAIWVITAAAPGRQATNSAPD
jgi:hypothetical protein